MIENLIGGLVILVLMGGALVLGMTRFGRGRRGGSVNRGPEWSTEAWSTRAMTEGTPSAAQESRTRTAERAG